MISSIISGTGSYIPSIKKQNDAFLDSQFLNADGTTIANETDVIIEKFKSITGIEERRYAKNQFNASDLGFFAAQKAIEDAGIDKETLDYIILKSATIVLCYLVLISRFNVSEDVNRIIRQCIKFMVK